MHECNIQLLGFFLKTNINWIIKKTKRGISQNTQFMCFDRKYFRNIQHFPKKRKQFVMHLQLLLHLSTISRNIKKCDEIVIYVRQQLRFMWDSNCDLKPFMAILEIVENILQMWLMRLQLRLKHHDFVTIIVVACSFLKTWSQKF